MKNTIIEIINDYLKIYPNEKERQSELLKYLENNDDNDILDWNNDDGHMVAGGYIINKENKSILAIYHKDMQKYTFPGGHIESSDSNPLEAAKREIYEETNLNDLIQVIYVNELTPFDIDTHIIEYKGRKDIPKHYHYDFKYLFIVNNQKEISVDKNEATNYKWIKLDELNDYINNKTLVSKLIDKLKDK